MADTKDLKSFDVSHEGSTPSSGTNFDRLTWLKRKRRENCLRCEPRQIPYSLIKTTCWCPKCNRVWIFRYRNPEDYQHKANRYWFYEDDPKGSFTRLPHGHRKTQEHNKISK